MKKPEGVSGLLAEYQRVECFIKIIHLAIGVLALVFIASAVRTGFIEGVWDAMKELDQLAFLASASLVTFVAHRQIIHANILREDQRRQDIVRVTHHLLAIVRDLRNRIHYTQEKLYDEKTVPVVLRSNAETISERFELLYARENFLHLSSKATEAIHSLSGSVFGLTALMTELASMRDRNPAPDYVTNQILPMAAQLKQSGAFESMKENLKCLEDELHQIRGTIDIKKT